MSTFIICASGQSLTQADVDYCKGKGTVIVINNTYIKAPWADVLYSCDKPWWQEYPEAMEFKGRKISIEFDQVEQIKALDKPGLGLKQIHTGGNSGYQAINWAFLQGAKKIILLGFDMHGTHWHGKHVRGLNKVQPFEKWINAFNRLAKDFEKTDVEVINCTPGTVLNCFTKQKLRKTI